MMRTVIFLIAIVFTGQCTAQSKFENELIQLTKDKIQHIVSDRYGAAVTIESGENEILNAHFGHTDSSNQFNVTAHTFFHIGSITKSVTALGIMQLVEQGHISLKDTLGKFFTNVPSEKSSISIGNLLQHTSGLRQTYVTDNIQDFNDAVNAILGDPLYYTPESSWSYSNSNYSLLAMIIEKVTKRHYEYYIRNKILLPLSMRETYFWGEIDDTNATYFAQKVYEPSAITKQRNWGYIGCGGLISTQANLNILAREILYERKLLKKETYELMFSELFKIRDGLSMGLGWFVSTDKNGRVEYWSRGSNDFGHNAVIRYFPEKKVLITVLTNSGEEGGNPRQTGNRIISDLILDQLH